MRYKCICFKHLPTHKGFLPIPPSSLPCQCLPQTGGRTESDKYKQWDGCVEGNYLPEPLAHRQHEDIHLFCIESDSLARRRGTLGRVREGMRQERV